MSFTEELQAATAPDRAALVAAPIIQGTMRGEVSVESYRAFLTATELMVAYAYDTIARGNPVGFFGMVHVLEGTSVALALLAADRIQENLGLPGNAFSYLRSHGTLDQEHTKHLARLLNALDDPRDRAAVTHAAKMFYRLYGDVFRGLPLPVVVRPDAPVAA